MNKLNIRNFILKKLKEYSKIPSLSYKEDKMFSYLLKDFKPLNNQTLFIEKRESNKKKLFLFLLEDNLTFPYIFVVHTDRIGNEKTHKSYLNTINSSKDKIYGQLDNILGIAILRYLHEEKIPLNILFTSREEVQMSWSQILQVISTYSYIQGESFIPISIDVDVFDKIDSSVASITLRTFDFFSKFDIETVKKLQRIAKKEKIKYSIDEYGQAYTEIGMLSLYTEGSIKGAHIGIPIENYHSDKECVFWNTVYDIIKLVKSFCKIKNNTLII